MPAEPAAEDQDAGALRRRAGAAVGCRVAGGCHRCLPSRAALTDDGTVHPGPVRRPPDGMKCRRSGRWPMEAAMSQTRPTGGVTLASGPIDGHVPPGPRHARRVAAPPRRRAPGPARRARRLPGRQRDGPARCWRRGPTGSAPAATRSAGVAVDLAGLDLPTDGRGLPIHGTMTAQPGWEVVGRGRGARWQARFDYGARPDLLAAFPFPHELRIAAAVDPTGLTVTTTVTADGRPGGPGRVRLPPLPPPARRRPASTSGCACRPGGTSPSTTASSRPGATHAEDAEDLPIGERTFDDLYVAGRRSRAGGRPAAAAG